jgi:hypothetical protein
LLQAAIVSQENSAMWVGNFDFEALEFTDEGTVFNFPRDNHCDVSLLLQCVFVAYLRESSCM